MVTSTYSIALNFDVENTKFVVPLIADVEEHHSEAHYVVKNFRAGPDDKRFVLPDLTIKRLNGHWVHLDSEMESHLSIQVGEAIDAFEHKQSHGKHAV